jgi:hypothetical protein
MADGNLSTWTEAVSARARRLGYPVEHFTGYSLVCQWCEKPFRCFREFEPFCGCCRDLKTPADGRY